MTHPGKVGAEYHSIKLDLSSRYQATLCIADTRALLMPWCPLVAQGRANQILQPEGGGVYQHVRAQCIEKLSADRHGTGWPVRAFVHNALWVFA